MFNVADVAVGIEREFAFDGASNLKYGSTKQLNLMRRAAATAHSASSTSAVVSPIPGKLGRLRAALPWLGAMVFAFLLFRLLFGHLYVMRGTCDCGHIAQWLEFNDRPYTIGVRFSSKELVAGKTNHDHLYQEPARAQRY